MSTFFLWSSNAVYIYYYYYYYYINRRSILIFRGCIDNGRPTVYEINRVFSTYCTVNTRERVHFHFNSVLPERSWTPTLVYNAAPKVLQQPFYLSVLKHGCGFQLYILYFLSIGLLSQGFPSLFTGHFWEIINTSMVCNDRREENWCTA